MAGLFLTSTPKRDTTDILKTISVVVVVMVVVVDTYQSVQKWSEECDLIKNKLLDGG